MPPTNLTGTIIGLPALKRDPKSGRVIDPPEGRKQIILNPIPAFLDGTESFVFNSSQITPSQLSYARMLFVDASELIGSSAFVEIVSGPYNFKVWGGSAGWIPFPALNPFNLNITASLQRDIGSPQPVVISILNFLRRPTYWSA